MNFQRFCEHIHILVRRDSLKIGSPTEQHVIEHILNKENPDLQQACPIYACLAIQIYDHLTNAAKRGGAQGNASTSAIAHDEIVANTNLDDLLFETKVDDERIKQALYVAFWSGGQQVKISQLRIAVVVEINKRMKMSQTEIIKYLPPLATSSCIMLTLFWMVDEKSENIDLFAVTDRPCKLNLPNITQPDLGELDSQLEEFIPLDKNPDEKMFEWCEQNGKTYDAFIFLTATRERNQIITDEMIKFRSKSPLNLKSKLIMVNLAEKKSRLDNCRQDQASAALSLEMFGWGYDSFLLLDTFLRSK